MRIVSLLPGATEALFAMGLGEAVVGVSHECDYPPAARRLPRVTRTLIDSAQASGQIDAQVQAASAKGGGLYEIDRPLIGRLQPDLIVTQAQCDVCAVRYADVLDAVASEESLRAAQIVALSPAGLDDLLNDVTRLGQAAGAVPAAEELAASLARRIEEIARRTRTLAAAERRRVVCIEWTEPLMTAGNWTPELVELAGGHPGLAEAGQHSGYVPWSSIVRYDPEIVIIGLCGFDLARSLVEARPLVELPGWQSLAAVRSGRVFVVDGNAYLNRSGPRLVDSLEILAHLIQPGLFGAPPSGEIAAWCKMA
jgi:iron complex transport system substrate-binding protein